ncbi:MAG: hypothetical protein ABW120_03830, partial [Sedimenticola sp.]
MALAALAVESPQDAYARLMDARRGYPVEEILARIVASWMVGEGAMPEWLGMGERGFRQMMQGHFPHFNASELQGVGSAVD